MKGIFPENTNPTIALEFGTKIIKLKNGVNIKVQIWDTGNKILFIYQPLTYNIQTQLDKKNITLLF